MQHVVGIGRPLLRAPFSNEAGRKEARGVSLGGRV